MDSEIENTVIALDVAFAALLRAMRDQQPGLAMLLRDALASGSKNQTSGLPGVTRRLAEYAALLGAHTKPSDRH